jgi:hypothetical protein
MHWGSIAAGLGCLLFGLLGFVLRAYWVRIQQESYERCWPWPWTHPSEAQSWVWLWIGVLVSIVAGLALIVLGGAGIPAIGG